MGISPPGNYYFLVPWVALIPWYGMLIAMLACWALQGHPIYWFMHEDQFPVYISDIGATNLQPLFIACVAWQGLWYCILVASEFWQRSGHWPFKWLIHRRHQISKDPTPDESAYGSDMTQRVWYAELLVGGNYLMPPYFTKHERNLIFASFVLGVFGELAILMCTIFSTAKHKRVHLSMVGLFISFMFFSILCNIVQYFMMGRHYAKTHPLAALDSAKRVSHWGCSNSGHIWNKYTISGIAKVIWLLLGAAWAFCFGGIRNRSTSACFEWLLAFWFGVYYIMASVDFYVGGRYMESKYFRQIESFAGYYKYDQLILSEPKIHLERFTDVSKLPNSQDDMQTADIVV